MENIPVIFCGLRCYLLWGLRILIRIILETKKIMYFLIFSKGR